MCNSWPMAKCLIIRRSLSPPFPSFMTSRFPSVPSPLNTSSSHHSSPHCSEVFPSWSPPAAFSRWRRPRLGAPTRRLIAQHLRGRCFSFCSEGLCGPRAACNHNRPAGRLSRETRLCFQPLPPAQPAHFGAESVTCPGRNQKLTSSPERAKQIWESLWESRRGG